MKYKPIEIDSYHFGIYTCAICLGLGGQLVKAKFKKPIIGMDEDGILIPAGKQMVHKECFNVSLHDENSLLVRQDYSYR